MRTYFNKHMANKKNKTTKKADPVSSVVIDAIDENTEEIDTISPKSKIKKVVEIEPTDILPEVLEEKIEEDTLPTEAEDEDEELPTLDDEELNPFGDKWEE